VRLEGLAGLADFVAKAETELAANAMICAVHQAVYLLNRQLRSLGRKFLEVGGFSERLHRRRQEVRSAKVAGPECPECGQPMLRRTVRKGSRAGEAFWGCSDYPDCRGTREVV